jgi:NADPH:quinone reductase-like Zn-dependent oxidoreductase
MKAVVTAGNGGYDKLHYKDVPVPEIGSGDVLLKVLAAGMNNTEINTRLGWYSSSVTSGTEQLSNAGGDDEVTDGGWNDKTPFPMIQGTDCCGEVVEWGSEVSGLNTGQRVLVRACMRKSGFSSLENIWMASDFDGAFAGYVSVPASEVFAVNCDWSDAELATMPCAYGTAENMIHRAAIGNTDRVLVTGASGGVGSAAVQLAKRRGAHVTAIAGSDKLDAVAAIGADTVLPRGTDLLSALGESSINAVFDNVAGEGVGQLVKLVARGGRYCTSGAIAGPLVEIDFRDFYLKDLSLIGCTAWDEPVFPNLVKYIERGEIKPLLAATYPLEDIAQAQQAFAEKRFVGNFVLLPDHD